MPPEWMLQRTPAPELAPPRVLPAFLDFAIGFSTVSNIAVSAATLASGLASLGWCVYSDREAPPPPPGAKVEGTKTLNSLDCGDARMNLN